MINTLFVVSFNLAIPPGDANAMVMAEECLRLFREDRRDELISALQDGRIASCGGALFAALLKSGLMAAAHPRIASDSLLSAWGEREKNVYYSAFSFE